MCEADGSRRRGLCESEFGLVEQGAQRALARCDATRVDIDEVRAKAAEQAQRLFARL